MSIILIKNNEFFIRGMGCQSLDEESVLKTLSRIEEAIQRGLKCANSAEDGYSKLSQNELYAELKQKAKLIRNGYLDNTLNKIISFFRRILRIPQIKKNQILTTYNRIENLSDTSFFLRLPDDSIYEICNFLPISDLRKFAQINQRCMRLADKSEVQRAKDYGYKGNHIAKAKKYLNNLGQAIHSLVRDQFIPRECIVMRMRWLFFHYVWEPVVDSEATLRKIFLDEKMANDKGLWNQAVLFYAKKGKTDVVRALISLGADINQARDEDGYAALGAAIVERKEEMAELLIQSGADVNATNISGSTPLMAAIFWGLTKLVHLLLEKDAIKVDLLNDNGNSALHFAAFWGQTEVVKLLLKHKVNTSFSNTSGKKAIYYANRKITALLKE